MVRKTFLKLHREEGGNVLLITFTIMILLSLITSMYLKRAQTESLLSARSKQASDALNYAEAGINDVLWRLNNISGWEANYPPDYANNEGQGRYKVWVTATGGLYTVISKGGFPGTAGAATTDADGFDTQKPLRKIRARMKLANFADYSRFVNGNVAYGAGARLQGKLHANGSVSCSSSDIIFYKDATCTGSFTGSTPDFRAAHVAGVPAKALPTSTLDLRSLALGQVAGKGKGLYFSSGKNIDLANIAALLPDDSTPPNNSLPLNFNGVIYVDADAVVSGIPDRGLMVSANGNILIDDHIRYPQQGGVTIPNATIGLVARDKIQINDTVDSSTHTELIIDAALMALNLNAANQPQGGNGWEVTGGGGAGSTLTINGSIITANGGSAGSYGTRNYNWDAKYSIYTPPFFPAEIGGNYEVSTWEQEAKGS